MRSVSTKRGWRLEPRAVLAGAVTTEAFLDAIRDFRQEEHFLIGVALLAGDLDPDAAGTAYAALAVGIVRVVLRQLREAFATLHGHLSGAALAVLAMGKLGSREMTATSDLDLVFLYTYDLDRPDSDGPKPLHAVQYFTRLTQRLVSHLTVSTRRGPLYNVDMRLRPSGRQGPLATKLSAFVPYQREDAATWEHMALTRARVVAGDDAFGRQVGLQVREILETSTTARLREDIAAMRALVEREKPARDVWDLKQVPGGLMDVEFIAQYVVLRHVGETPSIADPSTTAILSQAGRLGLLGKDHADRLIEAHRLFTNTTQIMRLALEEGQTPDQAGEAVKHRIAVAAGAPDFFRLVEEISTSRQAVRETFLAVLSDG